MRTREPLYWYDREKIEALGYCDEEVLCTRGFSMVHLCGRFKGHGGRHAAKTWTNGRGEVEKA